ncbi:hypothetical protein [Natronobiforma cellulositropha]|uniref:hypothetical protein n=1 Tax=Natronobiforma cellulositropha TaxID=1679076 RepID=UPI0021D5982B|nr:hypothetical protein [Natronobiforma cellulositropha]
MTQYQLRELKTLANTLYSPRNCGFLSDDVVDSSQPHSPLERRRRHATDTNRCHTSGCRHPDTSDSYRLEFASRLRTRPLECALAGGVR